MTFIEKLNQELRDSPLDFVANHPRSEQLFASYASELQTEIALSEKYGTSTDRYFELLEILTYQLFEIHSFDRFRQVYTEEAGWIKTEVKNTLNFCLIATTDTA